MHLRWSAAVVAVSLAVVTPLSLAAQVSATGASLTGSVTDSSDGAALAGALVTAGSRSATTDADGRFSVTGLPREILTVTVRLIGYGPRAFVVDLRSGSGQLGARLASRPVQLEDIVVTGATDAERALHDYQSITTLSATEVEQQRGQTLGETLREVPGVAVIQVGPSIAKPVVRGLHSQRVRVMNGDVPQEGQQWGEEHAPEIDAFAANEIEVIRGSGFVLYGSDAIGGVVRVLPRPLPDSGGLGGEFTTNLFANNRQGAASLLLEGSRLALPLVGHVDWRVQGSWRRAGDARTPDYFLRNTGFAERNANVSLGVSRPWGTSQLTYSRFATELGMYLGAHVGTVTDLERAMSNPLRTSTYSDAINRPNQRVSHDLVSWRASVILGRAAMLDVNYGFQYNHRAEYDGIGFASGSTRPAFGLELYTHSVDVRVRHAPVGRLSGTIGITGMRQGNLSPGRSFLIPQYRLYSAGVYALEQIAAGRWTVSAGLRYDYRWQHAYQFGDPVVISPEERRAWSGLAGSLGVNLEFAPGWSIASTVGRAWRAPNVSERFSAGVHHGTAQYQLGDSSITSERGWNADATLRHVGRATRLELSAYENRIAGFIYLRPFGDVATVRGAYPGYRFAQTDALLRGLDASLQIAPTPWGSIYLSGTAVRGRDRRTGDALFDMPADRVIANVRITAGSSARLTAPYVELGTTLVRKQDYVPPNTVYRLPTEGYALLNLEVGAAGLNLIGQSFVLSLAARNVLDRRYRDYLSRYRLFVDEPGRDVVLRLSTYFGPTRSR
jgi:iron complex outermembrane receptor protein